MYCGTRKDTESLAGSIAREGLTTVTYHAGMNPQARQESQAAFMEGRAEVVVATTAFGMRGQWTLWTGCRTALPTSLEADHQEAGRAGRDGEPARALLLSARVDLGRLIRFIKDRETSVEDVKRYVARLRLGAQDGVVAIGHGELDDRGRVLLSIAEGAGAVELEPGGRDGLLVKLTGREARAWPTWPSKRREIVAGSPIGRSSASVRTGRRAAGARSWITSATGHAALPRANAAMCAIGTGR